jgi:ribosome biogenesis GTPase
VLTEEGELLAEVSGKLRHEAIGREDYPAVGDWVVLDARPEEGKATIHSVLPRYSKFSRKAAGNTTEEQIVATNVNTVFLVNALNLDFNVRRIERYLLLAWESGANPVIVLSKADLCEDTLEKVHEVEAVAFGVPIHVVSVMTEDGIEALSPYLGEGKTVALMGSSGAGKSTLINLWLGEDRQKVLSVREGDDRGRHTTTHREMFLLPGGGLMIDTPGMRELQLWHADEGVHDAFGDITALFARYRFADCMHGNEPGCAVQRAIAEGKLTAERLASYRKLERELGYLAAKEQGRTRLIEKARKKQVAQFNKMNRAKQQH